MAQHRCAFTHHRDYVMLSLPERDGHYELFQSHRCQCGRSWDITSYALNTGRHPSLAELRATQAREEAQPHTKGGMRG
jgi:hypothetical protein